MHEPPTSSDAAPQMPSELRVLHEAITATLKAAIPQFQHVEAYPILKEGMKLPALLYAATNFAPAARPGDGRLCITVTFEAAVMLEANRGMAPLQAAILAAKVLQVLQDQYWDVDFVDQPMDAQAMPSEFIPQLARCTGWSVMWRQNVYLGETEWPWENEPPGSLVFGFDPDTGAGSEGHYQGPEDMA